MYLFLIEKIVKMHWKKKHYVKGNTKIFLFFMIDGIWLSKITKNKKDNRSFKVAVLNAIQGRNHGKMLAATSVMVGRICPPWLG